MPKPKPDLLLCEIHDREEYKEVMRSLGESTTHEMYKKELAEVMKTIKKNEKKVKYFYKLIDSDGAKYGRLYAEGSCFQTMPSNYRGHFCHKNYIGLDISNAHPNLINGLFKHFKIDCKEIDDYCNNRDDVAQKYGVSKSFVNSICNFELFDIKNGIKDEDLKDDKFFHNIKSCVYEKLFPILTEKYPKLYAVSRDNKIKKNKQENNKDVEFNVKGSFIANFLMTLENKIIMACYETLKNDYSIDAIIHDELFIKKTEDTEVLCNKLRNIVKNTDFMGIPFDFELKFKVSKYEPYEAFVECVNEMMDDQRTVISDGEGGVKKTDSEIAGELVEMFKNKIFKYSDDIYTYSDNVWKINSDDTLKGWILSCGITRIDGSDKRPPSFICDETTHLKAFYDQFRYRILNEFHDDIKKFNMLNNQIGVIPFLNGYYDIINKNFVRYTYDTEPVYFTHKIMRNYNENNDFTEIRKIILDIFDTEELMDEVMSFFARAMAGHVEDKVWLNMVGERDSGKGVLHFLLVKAFGSFVGLFNSGDLALKKSLESAERKNGFLSNFCNSRVAICSEVPSGEFKFDGTIIKTCASGGDEVRFRESYGKIEVNRIKALMCIMGQSIPVAEPRDAMNNSLICNLPCKFVAKTDNAEEEEEKGKNIKIFKGYITKVADPSLKTKINNSEKLIDSFIGFLFTFYKPKVPEYKMLREAVKDVLADDNVNSDPYEDIMKYIRDKYVITNNASDKIARSEFNKNIINHVFHTATTAKIVSFMTANGFQSRKIKGVYYYKGLRPMTAEENEED